LTRLVSDALQIAELSASLMAKYSAKAAAKCRQRHRFQNFREGAALTLLEKPILKRGILRTNERMNERTNAESLIAHIGELS